METTTAPVGTPPRAPQDHPAAFTAGLVAWVAMVPGLLALGFSLLLGSLGLLVQGQDPEGAPWLFVFAFLAGMFGVGVAAPHLVTVLVLRRHRRVGRLGAWAPVLVLLGSGVTVLAALSDFMGGIVWGRPVTVVLWGGVGAAWVEALLLALLTGRVDASRP